MLSMLGKNSADHIIIIIEIFFLFFFFFWKQSLTFHANCLLHRQFAWNIKHCFLEKKKRPSINLLSAECAQRVLKVNARLALRKPAFSKHRTQETQTSCACLEACSNRSCSILEGLTTMWMTEDNVKTVSRLLQMHSLIGIFVVCTWHVLPFRNTGHLVSSYSSHWQPPLHYLCPMMFLCAYATIFTKIRNVCL